MSRIFTRERCIPWLFSQAGVRFDDNPQEVAPDIDRLDARLPGRTAAGFRIVGIFGMFAAAIVLMSAMRPARADGASLRSPVLVATGGVLGGLSVGALIAGRRIGRNAPALVILCAGRRADIGAASLKTLVGPVAEPCAPGRGVWLISEATIPSDAKASAKELEVRCFALASGRIVEV